MTLEEFVDGLLDSLPEVRRTARFCDNAIASLEPSVKLPAASLLYVVREMQAYLSYYEENIEKGFGVSSIPEQNRLENATSGPLLRSLRSIHRQGLANSLQNDLSVAVAQCIDDWRSFDKESVEDVLATNL